LAKKRKRANAAIGIDIGGTKTLFALLDQDFEVVAEEKLRSRDGKDPLASFEKRDGAGHRTPARRRPTSVRLKVKIVGVGVAGVADFRTGAVRSAPNLDFLDGFPLGARLKKLTGARVFVANDVHTGLYGECMLGSAKRSTHVLGVWLGTGVGGAMVIDGKLPPGRLGRGRQHRQLRPPRGRCRAGRAPARRCSTTCEPHRHRGRCGRARGEGARAEAQEDGRAPT
jgi:glucokinase